MKGEIMEYIVSFWKNIVNFKGRARRKELGFGMISVMVIGVALAIVSSIISAIVDKGIVTSILGLLTSAVSFGGYLAVLSAEIRRFHDTGKPWFWVFLGCIPAVGSLVLLYFLFFIDSEPGDNQWGPNPKGMNSGFTPNNQGFDAMNGYNQGYFNTPQNNSYNLNQPSFGMGQQMQNQGFEQTQNQQNMFNNYNQQPTQDFNQQPFWGPQNFSQEQSFPNQGYVDQNNNGSFNQGFNGQNYGDTYSMPNQPMNNMNQNQMQGQGQMQNQMYNPNMQNYPQGQQNNSYWNQ